MASVVPGASRHHEAAVAAHIDLEALHGFCAVADALDAVVPTEVEVLPAAGGDRVRVGQGDAVGDAPTFEFAELVLVEDDKVGRSAGDADVGQPAVFAPCEVDHLGRDGDCPDTPLDGGVLAAFPVARGVGAVEADAFGVVGMVDGEDVQPLIVKIGGAAMTGELAGGQAAGRVRLGFIDLPSRVAGSGVPKPRAGFFSAHVIDALTMAAADSARAVVGVAQL